MVPVDFCEEGEADEKAYFGLFDDHEIYTFHTIPIFPLEVFGIFFGFFFLSKMRAIYIQGHREFLCQLRVG
jgi:hypothetical protein